RRVGALRDAQGVRRAGPVAGGGRPGRRPHGRAAGRAADTAGSRRGLARRPLPQPPVRPALDPRPVAGEWVPGHPNDPGAAGSIAFSLSEAVPDDAGVVGVPVFPGRSTPGTGPQPDMGRLAQRGFEGKLCETMVVPSADGRTVVAVGMGPEGKVDAEALRRAAAALVK